MLPNTPSTCSATLAGITTDPVNGDQFHQHDDRIYGGAGASRTVNGTLFDLPTQTVFGLQTRYDDINVGLSNTVQRQLLSNTLFDHVNEGNVGIYAQNTTHWTDWWRTTLGWRGDYFAASVNSMLQSANSGNPTASIGSPKFTTRVRTVLQNRVLPWRRHGLS